VVLSIEVDYLFDRPEVAGFLVVCSGIADILKAEFVFASGYSGLIVSVPARW
jgi:hypothetical protein